jgi:tetratricopeptide (TPR) repeat protein
MMKRPLLEVAMRWTPTTAFAAGAAALALALAAAPVPAGAVDLIIGGRAEMCSRAAKAGLADPLSVENCTVAITGEPIWGHALAATYVNRGTMFLALMNYGSALRDFDEAIAIEPSLGEAYVNRGGALIGLKRYTEALAEIDKGIALNPDEPEKAYGNRALAKWSLDDLKGAYADFLKAQELKPDWTWPAEQLSHFTLTPAK